MQKAAVVKLIQSWSVGTVLAIGDGANDVAMIQVFLATKLAIL